MVGQRLREIPLVNLIKSPSAPPRSDPVRPQATRSPIAEGRPDPMPTSERPAISGSRRVCPERQRLGKGPVGRLAPQRPRTPIREGIQTPRDLPEIVEDNRLPSWSPGICRG
jgi:hypothetical protein